MSNAVVAKQVGHTFATGSGPVEVLRDVQLEVEAGEFVTIVGSSGAGKSTLLRCLAGLMSPSSGNISVFGEELKRPSKDVGIVFQDYSRSLYPWLSNYRNVELPLLDRGLTSDERRRRVNSSLDLVGLASHSRGHPWQLSGGMQQRVAIARALAYQPKVLLMDEPFGALDAQTRAELQDVTLALRRDLGVSVLFVTHDIDEAIYLGDRVVVLAGKPGTITKQIDVSLPAPRNQMTTKGEPAFSEARQQVLRDFGHDSIAIASSSP